MDESGPVSDTDTRYRSRSPSVGCSEVGTSSSLSDSSHLFQPTMPSDIARCCDDHPVQPHFRSFRKRQMGDRSRSFAAHWYDSYPFLEYSVQRDAVFCFSCRLFSSHSGGDTVFTKQGFNNWRKTGDKLKKHADSDTHKESMARWAIYKQKQSTTIVDELPSERAKAVALNRKYIITLSKLAVLCARQNIPLRGHDESSESDNKGNFAEILEFLFPLIPEIHNHFHCLPKHARYMSKDIQNDLLKAATDVVLQQICDEIKESEGFTIIADET